MDFSTAPEACQRLFGINSYKPRQVECLEAFWQGRDVLAVLPTGYGKSLIFQTLPFIMQQKTGQMMSVIVITPINALMMDQCLKLNSRGIRACYLDYLCESAASAMCDVTDVDDDVETEEAQVTSEVEGQIMSSIPLAEVPGHTIIYAHPETLLCTKGRVLLKNIAKDICALVIDEAHIILEW
jgi:superfamily II DNA helicase RecQ